ASQHRPAADAMVTDLFLLDAGMVRRKRHVDDDRHLRVDAIRAHERAAAVPGDFLLSGCRGDDTSRAGILRVATQRLEHDERTNAIVDRARDDTIVWKVDGFRVDDARVAHTQST